MTYAEPEHPTYAEDQNSGDPLPPTPPRRPGDTLGQTLVYSIEPPPLKRDRRRRGGSCLWPLVASLAVVLLLALLLLLPGRTNILLLGLDARPDEGDVGRSDTMILTTFLPHKGYTGALSIPRDLWVSVPGNGENRINTAHFFGELAQPGGGPAAAKLAVQENFGVGVDYYVRIRFDSFQDVIDAMGGVDVEFPEPMSGYTAGTHHLDGEQALALVRDRQGSDDFSRMGRGQLFLKAVWKQALKPSFWLRLPGMWKSLAETVDMDVPIWLWPRLGLTLMISGPDGIDARTIEREMVTPFTTTGGAQVLAPNWELINPVLLEMFGQ